tara:strand:- start:39 stop:269 length:231 start_codon:yes stop_codon:yes gene_type:complete
MFDLGFYELALVVVLALLLFDKKDVGKILFLAGHLTKSLQLLSLKMRSYGKALIAEATDAAPEKEAPQKTKSQEKT